MERPSSERLEAIKEIYIILNLSGLIFQLLDLTISFYIYWFESRNVLYFWKPCFNFQKEYKIGSIYVGMYFTSTSHFLTDKKKLVIRNDNFSFKDWILFYFLNVKGLRFAKVNELLLFFIWCFTSPSRL